MSFHQDKQKEVIAEIEEQIKNNSLTFSTVTPIEDFENDTRLCLTSVHVPSSALKQKIEKEILQPLREVQKDCYYYDADSLHMTMKNVRVISDPPHFTKTDEQKAKEVFSHVVPRHKKFSVYFYRLLLFPNNLALVGTTDEELDNIVLDLDKELKKAGVPDDKKYTNEKYFFSNMTLARFHNVSDTFKEKVAEISKNLSFAPYTVDAITLASCNAIFKKRNIIGEWQLK